ncbi:MAG: hypothetical protein ACREUW_18155 [Burkholderiales bacterium]
MPKALGGILLAAALATFAGGAPAADAGATGPKIFCWKNATGKTECGDRAPQDAQVRQLNQRGVTVNTKEAALTPEQAKAREEEEARKKIEKTRQEQQQRRDRALLDTFTTEQEIEAKRKREVSNAEAQITNLETTLRNATDRQTQATQRAEDFRKGTGKVPQAMQDEVTRIEQEKLSLNSQIARKRKDITEINANYAELRARFVELKGGAAPGAKATPTPAPDAKAAPTPTATPAPGLKAAPTPPAAPAPAAPAPAPPAKK